MSPSPNVPRPSIFDFTGKAKWDAWNAAGETYKERPADAEARYLEIARSLEWTEGKPAELELVRHATGDEDEEEDIWDTDADTPKQKGGDGGIGRVMSTMIMDGEDEESTSAVSKLAISGDAEALGEYLQEHPEVDINTPDENVSTPGGETGSCLLQSQGYTALHLAADRGHAEVVKVLLERGADRDIKVCGLLPGRSHATHLLRRTRTNSRRKSWLRWRDTMRL